MAATRTRFPPAEWDPEAGDAFPKRDLLDERDPLPKRDPLDERDTLPKRDTLDERELFGHTAAMSQFAEFGLDGKLVEALATRGIVEATDVQSRVLPPALAGSDLIFRSATGTGKTIAYLAPLLQALAGRRRGVVGALVLAPTAELCAQIRREVDALGAAYDPPLAAALLTGEANIQRQIERLRSDKKEIAVGTPARVAQLQRMGKLKTGAVAFLVLDEADRLMADELQESTQRAVEALPRERQTLACSATLEGRERERVEAVLVPDAISLDLDDAEVLRSSIEHWAFYEERRRKAHALRSLLAALKPQRALVFVDDPDRVLSIAAQLRHHKLAATALAGAMGKVERKKSFDDFRSGRAAVMVTSDLASRGLDIPGAGLVVQLDVSERPSVYAHRAGRTGRAGATGVMATIGDETELRRLAGLERKLGILVHPKLLYRGGVIDPPEEPETLPGGTPGENAPARRAPAAEEDRSVAGEGAAGGATGLAGGADETSGDTGSADAARDRG